ncbi:MAG: YkvA family protein [Chloroflexota bacterium]
MAKKKRDGAGGKAMGLGGAFRMLPMLWKYGQLAFSLLQDTRVPAYLKIGLISGALLVLSPIDLIPEAIPVLGQISDFFILLVVIQLFLRLVPKDVVDEHIEKLGLQGQVKVLLRPR